MTDLSFAIRSILAPLFLLNLGACGADDTREQRLAVAGPNPDFAALMKVADPDVGARKFSACAGCHHIRPGAPDVGGPNLYGIFNKAFATNSQRFGYTAPLRDYGGHWDEATLDRWMSNPKAMIPATSMQYAGMTNPLDRADVIAYIRSRRD